MASTNKTSNLELSQFIATDTPTWLVDYNGDMEKIDAGVGRVEELAETASTQAVGVASGLQTTNQNVTTLSGQVANVQNQANNTTASVNVINQRLGNADIRGIGDGTITGAIIAQNSKLDEYKYGNKIFGSSSDTIPATSWASEWFPITIPEGYTYFTALCGSDNDVVCGVSVSNYDVSNNRLLINAYNRHTQARDFSHVYMIPIYIRN